METFCLIQLGAEMPLAFSVWRSEMLLKILKYTGKSLTTKNYLASHTTSTKVKEASHIPRH